MSDIEQLRLDLGIVTGTVAKIAAETSATLAKVEELEALLADNNDEIPQDILDTVAGIRSGLEAVDALVPDTIPGPLPEATPEPVPGE